MRSEDIRGRFQRFFVERGHTLVPSASTVADDPTLLLTNAGMVPFKPYFLGQLEPPYRRATSVQKCVRTPDIEVVGTTSRHVTFFEMCGNFSFGDYFKEKAIPFAWDLLTKPVADGGYGFDEERLWVTVYLDDDEAERIWAEDVGVARGRIQRRGKADNFWSMGVPGPCGPCSEIYYDRGPQFGNDGGPEADEERYLEVWNLVFMQDERGAQNGPDKDSYDVLRPLPARNIDTGMGLDRMAIILQGVEDIFATDLLSGTLDKVADLTGKRMGKDPRDDVSLRVVADHVRTAAFLIGDGVTPGNEGRGYVLRRLLRRAVRNMVLLGAEQDGRTIPTLLTEVSTAMGSAYPELVADLPRIQQVAGTEEQAFLRTLDQGSQRFVTEVESLRESNSKTVSGDVAFRLHDTYGFPIDLTLEMAAERGLEVDADRFRALMKQQRERAQADRKSKGIGNVDVGVYRDFLAKGPVEFLAYQGLNADSIVRGLVKDHVPVPAASDGDVVEVILDRTSFYAESGGQDSDSGRIVGGGGLELEVLDVQRPVKGLIVHLARVLSGEIAVGDAVETEVDPEWRLGACQAHSGTHIVHAALRHVLGPSALQSGSYNKPGYLRLDFAWPSGLSAETRSEVEEVSNLAVRRDLPAKALFMTLSAAKDFGALALFGETYDDQEVRVVEIGGQWSRELCGGTHVQRTSQVGLLVFSSESSVGAGVRRVEALVGQEGFRALARERTLVDGLSELLKVPGDLVPERVAGLVTKVRDLEKELASLRARASQDVAAELARNPSDLSGVAWIAHTAPEGTPADALRALAQDLVDRLAPRPAVAAVLGVTDGRAQVVVSVNPPGRALGHQAGALVKVAAPLLGGGGGGRDDVAQGGGGNAAGIPDAVAAMEQAVGERAAGAV